MPERGNFEEEEEETQVQNNLKEKKLSWGKLRRVDSLNLEAGNVSTSASHTSKFNWAATLSLAFQSIGIVYGDIGTSPLYVYASTFSDGIGDKEDILGVLSLIIYTIVLIPLIKYVFIVLWANDNGDGGTFALYSLLCRYAKVGLIPKDQPEDNELSNYKLDTPSINVKRAEKIKEKLENSRIAKIVLFIVTILGTSMVIGDGVLTPCISVLSAVSGIDSLGKDAVVGISVAILIVLFSAQRFGTDKVGTAFAPIICIWFSFIGGIGLYNLFKYDLGVLRAFYPKYMVDYFRRNGKKGWISLGGVVMCITGTEAMFADLGHFNVRAIQLSFSFVALPSLLAAYSGQAAFLTKFPNEVANTFYESIPGKEVNFSLYLTLNVHNHCYLCCRPLYWPTFVIAVAAAIIASQAMISGAFAIVSQSLTLNCFPRVKVVHTSAKYVGQVYIPEVNYMLMVACVIVCAAFQTTENIGHAYGIAVVAVMVMTTFMVALIMLIIWRTRISLVLLFFVVFFLVEMVYLSSVLYKFKEGGYLPLGLAFFLVTVMGIWHYAQRQRYIFELNNKVSSESIRELVSDQNVNRIPGIGLLYSELVQGIPPIFPHFIANVPSVHSVLVCVSIKLIPISKVTLEERFLFRQVEPREYRMFRCIVRYGYNDPIEEAQEFEHQLVENLKEFIRHEHFIREGVTNDDNLVDQPENPQHSTILSKDSRDGGSTVQVEESRRKSSLSSGSIRSAKSRNSSNQIIPTFAQGAEEEMQFVQKAMEKGVVYLLGEAEVVAEPNSSVLKKMVVNYAYSFLRKNFRGGEKVLEIPRTRLLKVGMTYEI